MHIVTLVAADRGRRCLEKILALKAPEDRLDVFTFKETPWEPPFSQSILDLSHRTGSPASVTTKVHQASFQHIWDARPDIIFVVGWRYMIPASVYESAKVGCFVFHDSMLPKYRGFSPSVWSMRNGEASTGATLFEIAEGVDEGRIVCQREVPFTNEDEISSVTEKVTRVYLEILEAIWPQLPDGLTLREQDHSVASYTSKLIPEDFYLDFNTHSTATLHNYVRSYSRPYPGAFTRLNGDKLTIWKARIQETPTYVGSIPGRPVSINSDGSVTVATSDGLLRIETVSVNDGAPLSANQVINKLGFTLGRN